MQGPEDCQYSESEICQLYCTESRKLCIEVSDFDILFSGIQQLQEARDLAVIEANTDKLTGLLNKAALFEIGEQMVRDTELGDDAFGLIMLDISNFKQFNDTHGHLAGDELLTKLGVSLRQLLRGNDYIAARFGGDEFVMLCKLGARDPNNSQTPEERILSITQRLYTGVGLVLATESEFLLPAFGASVWRPGETFEDLLVRADQLMYKNKRGQKNITDQDD